MQSSVRTFTKDIIVRPSPIAGHIEINIFHRETKEYLAGDVLDLAQAAALILALECAAETAPA
jgi:hypothetical protein